LGSSRNELTKSEVRVSPQRRGKLDGIRELQLKRDGGTPGESVVGWAVRASGRKVEMTEYGNDLPGLCRRQFHRVDRARLKRPQHLLHRFRSVAAAPMSQWSKKWGQASPPMSCLSGRFGPHFLWYNEHRVCIASQQVRHTEQRVQHILVDTILPAWQPDHEALQESARGKSGLRKIIRVPMAACDAPAFFTPAEKDALLASRPFVGSDCLVAEGARKQHGVQDRDRHPSEQAKDDLRSRWRSRWLPRGRSPRKFMDNRRAR
jgi:hypothetical protein